MTDASEREKLGGKTPDTPESLALWVWDKFVGCPITEPYDAMYLLLLERLKFMHRATFTAGLHEALRQRAALDSSGVRELREALEAMVNTANWTTVPKTEEEFDAMIAKAEAALAHSKEGK